ncbi:hypothetical protein N7455_011084 [Penicillium solitum]|uniref:uncharacterized protein n=1 Tax=Penicillium solitum TaxID=60172 RepID=UPI0018180DED|nr:hypothetical protein HAV15_000709 [Penicillium sp. str. \
MRRPPTTLFRFGDTLSSNFTDIVETCLNDYCKNPYPDLGGCGNWHGTASLPFVVNTTQGSQYFWNNATCTGVSDGVNADIGGPGVFVSYLLQLGITFYFWILLRSFRLFPILTSFCTRRKQTRDTASSTKQTKGNVITKTRHFLNQHDRITKVILVEFQEAQCFFMFASQSAILLAKKSTTIFESNTMPSLWANNGIAGVVSSAGVLPIVMGMWSLQKMHLTEPWIFLLSVTTIIVSEFALYWTHETSSVGQISPFDYNGWPESCGGYAPPLIYCVDPAVESSLRLPLLLFWEVLNPYCLTVFGLDVIFWFWAYVVRIVDVEGVYQGTCARLGLRNFPSKVRRLLDSTWGEWVKRLPGLLTFCVEALFLAAVFLECMCFAEFGHLKVIDFSGWGFGQIVALAIWFPVASKYAYLVLFGTESYSQARMPESDHTDEHKDITNKDAHDVELAPLRSTDVIQHKAQDGHGTGK